MLEGAQGTWASQGAQHEGSGSRATVGKASEPPVVYPFIS